MPTNSGLNRTLSLVRKICQAALYFALLAFISATLISCAAKPAKKDTAENAQHSSQQAKASAAAEDQQNRLNLPDVELSADLMYKIMLSDLARQQNNNELALAALVDAAIETRDPRLAAQATRQAVISNQYTTAIQMARLWQALSPDSVDVYQTLGNLLIVEKQPDEAIVYYSKALALTDENNRSQLLKQISATMIRYSSQEQALRNIEQLATEYPQSADVALAHAGVASALKHYDVANTAINRTLALDPDNANAAVFKFSLLLLQEMDKDAEEFALHFLKKHPKSIDLRTTLARYYLENTRLKSAEKQYLIIHRQDRTSIIAPMALALIRMDSKDYDAASQYLEKVLELQSDNDLARVYLGDIATLQERLDDAIQWYRSVTDKDQLFSSRLRLIDVVMKRDGIDAALREMEALHPETASQQIDLILLENELLSKSGRTKEALELINKALEDSPDDLDLLYARGMIAASVNDVAGLEKDMLRILELKPGHVQALNAYGFTLADLTNRYKEAYSLISAALKQRPGDPYILDSMGWVEFRLGNYADAETYLRRALELRNDPEIA
ncbi:MAG: tetratricopeptide repeat protein, partial [Gammaproteobacteria bacterium]|nr:tetratricopeptide repeat protein [Gammaproteobacteria bacterium]